MFLLPWASGRLVLLAALRHSSALNLAVERRVLDNCGLAAVPCGCGVPARECLHQRVGLAEGKRLAAIVLDDARVGRVCRLGRQGDALREDLLVALRDQQACLSVRRDTVAYHRLKDLVRFRLSLTLKLLVLLLLLRVLKVVFGLWRVDVEG